MLIVFFGLSGAGKSHVAQQFAQWNGYIFHEGDNDLPQFMKDKIKDGINFTQEDVDVFTDCMISSIKGLKRESRGRTIVMSQALYRNQNREQLLKAFPDTIFVQVTAPDQTIMDRVNARNQDGKSEVTQEYFDIMKTYFQEPEQEHFKLNNSGFENISNMIALNKYVAKRAQEPLLRNEGLSR
jgi:gluconate kinase